MNINEILRGFKCPKCGREHKCDIESVIIEKGAISSLTTLVKPFNSILVVADENTERATQGKVFSALDGKKVRKVIFSGDTVLIPNEDAINTVKNALDDADLIVGIGSGVIQDLCKYVAHFEKLPYMVVATAPSMDGYASNGAAMILKGMKETVPAGLPKAIIADTEVLKNAPMEMIKAGYGDIIGKFSALNDWKLSNLVNGEYLCEYIYDTTYQMIDKTLKTAKGLLNRDENSIKSLTEALVVVGIMMSFATTSRPASGSEHHLSHFFEITGIVHNKPYLPHGIDVAYSTVVTAKIRQDLTKRKFPDTAYTMPSEEYEQKMTELYGAVGKECIALQNRIGNYKKDRICIYKSKENEIKEILAEMPSSEQIDEMLKIAELDVSELYNTYGEQKINDAILYAKDLKDRYTVLWLNYETQGK